MRRPAACPATPGCAQPPAPVTGRGPSLARTPAAASRVPGSPGRAGRRCDPDLSPRCGWCVSSSSGVPCWSQVLQHGQRAVNVQDGLRALPLILAAISRPQITAVVLNHQIGAPVSVLHCEVQPVEVGQHLLNLAQVFLGADGAAGGHVRSLAVMRAAIWSARCALSTALAVMGGQVSEGGMSSATEIPPGATKMTCSAVMTSRVMRMRLRCGPQRKGYLFGRVTSGS